MKTKFLFLIILSFIVIADLFPQTDSVGTDISVITYDTLEVSTVNTVMHSPKKAVLLSTFIPGAGQIYNKQAWKVPVIYAAAAGVTYFAVTNGKNRVKFKNEYYNRINGNTDELLEDYVSYTNDGIYNLYNAYKSNFQLSLIVGVAFYLIQVVDAYVYGHLFSFDLSEDLSMSVAPCYIPSSSRSVNSGSLGISLNWRF